MGIRELSPVKARIKDIEDLENEILRVLRLELYGPLVNILGIRESLIFNSDSDLISAIVRGTISFHRGMFTGKFNSRLSRELRDIGAVWDARQKAWKIPSHDLPHGVREAVSLSDARFERTLERINHQLDLRLPQAIAERLDIRYLFDSAIWRTERKIESTLKGITVSSKLTDYSVSRIADEYTNNMRLYIKDWAEEEIVSLREKVQRGVFRGDRYENLVKTIQRSYQVGRAKAAFLARQETNLLVAKFKETRYTENGIVEYRWRCVKGSPLHPVREHHKKNDGKIFRFDSPPTVNERGDRKNPGEDYNCRCMSHPIVRF